MNNKKNKMCYLFTFILIILFLFTSMISSGILAKYTYGEDLNEGTKVAKFDVDVSLKDKKTSTEFITLQNYQFYPGVEEKIDIKFNGLNNEVDVKCTITFELVSMLPLEIYYDSNEVSTSGIETTVSALSTFTISDITIRWDSINNSYLYNGQVATINIIINVEQID